MKVRRLGGNHQNQKKRAIAMTQKQGKKSDKSVKARLLHVIRDVRGREKGKEEESGMTNVPVA